MKKENIILISLIILFLIITGLVIIDVTLSIDHAVYDFLISFKSDKLTYFFKFFTKFANVKTIVIIVLLFLIIKRNILRFYPLIVAVDVELLNLLLKFIVKRDRPNILQLVTVDNYSYPSGHAMMSMGVYGCFIYLIYKYVKNKKVKIIGISILSILILLIGISRIYLGVHYFSDIIGGYIASICYLIIFSKVIRKWGIDDEKINSK
ncbi:MAG: phosphatase PAP2 family protein [Bacilli bacterium]|nr:phosphatase PAP2 family protein [Bacilli bacterium]